MSKSLGNVIDPIALVNEYGTDAVRYFLAREVSTFEDSDVTLERIKEAYNANLANGLGNLVSRVMKMAENMTIDNKQLTIDKKMPAEIQVELNKYEIQKGMDLIWERIQKLDQKIQESEPYKLIKTDPDKAKEIIGELVKELHVIASSLVPFLPETSEKILAAIKENRKPQSLFGRKK